MDATTIRILETRSARRHDERPWYRQFWFWFLVILPATSVVLSFLTLYLALATIDPVVPHEGDSRSWSAPHLSRKTPE